VEEKLLAASLSLLLPVCNAQRGLESQVERVLDLLPDLSDRFDVVIIDDGSTDETHEVASDLARRYPQVDVIRHHSPRGFDEAIEAGRKRSTSEVVLVHESAEPLDATGLANLWSKSSGASPLLPKRNAPAEAATATPPRRRKTVIAAD
jgi:glycosyltransferase involved in cell wall biosynthesis